MEILGIQGGLWRTTSVSETPEIVLRRWTIRELDNGDRHFVGYNVTEGEGRVSSKIVEFDPKTMRGKTRSGRVYQLDGESSINIDAEYVWNGWCAMYRIESWKDVSEEAC